MLAWAPSVECSKSCHARSTSRRIGYESNLWPVERDPQDFCRRLCSNSTGYSEVSIRAGHLPQPEFCLPESDEAKSEPKVDENQRDGERFRVERGLQNQIGEYVQDYGGTLGELHASVPTETWLSGPSTSTPTEGQHTGGVSRCRDHRTSTPSSTNQLHSNSRDSFEGCNSLRSSASTNADQRVIPHAQREGEVEAPVTRRLRIGEEASDHVLHRASSLKNVSQLAEKGRAPHNNLTEGLDDSESTRSGRGGSQKERSSTWTEDVELVRSGPIFFGENIVECTTDIGVGERNDFGFHNVIDSHASLGKGHAPTAESGKLRSLKLYHSKAHPHERQERTNAIPESPQSQLQDITELASRGASCDALGIESVPQSSVCDQPQLGSTRTRIERGLPISRSRSDSEKDLEEIATKGRRYYPERVGNIGAKGVRQINPERAGNTPTRRKSEDTAGVHTIPGRIGGTSEGLTVLETVEVSRIHSAGERGGVADSYSSQEGIGGRSESFTIRERTGGSPSEGNKIPERIGGSDRDSAGKVLEKGKEEKLHSREEVHQRQSEPSEERRLRARVDASSGGASGGGDETEEPKVVRPARPSGGKDRHSKVHTAKGPRDRRVRLSVPTAVQFYDVQDRLGFDQPSKAVEWLIQKAKDAIDELGRGPVDGKEGPRVQGVCGSDISHHGPPPSSYNAAVSGLVSGSSSCTLATSFQGISSNPYGDQLSFFMDPSITQGMFAPLQPNQGNFAGPTFGLGRIDLTRGNSGSTDGGRSNELTGSPLARVESRTKARERARERTKKGPGRDGSQGQVTGGGSPSSSQSPPFHSNPSFSSFNASNSVQGSVHSLSLHNPHQNPLLSGVYEGNQFSRLMQGSHQTGPFHNLIMHHPPLESQFNDQIQSPLQNAFLVQPQATLVQSPSHTMNSLQQSHLQIMQVNAQGALHLGSTFNPGPSSSSSADAPLSSSHFTSVSTLPLSQSLSAVPQLSVLGISPASSLGPQYPTGSPGFSPGPTTSAFRAHSLSISQSSNQNHLQKQQLQGVSRVQRPVASFSAAPSISTSQAGSSSSRVSIHPHYSSNTQVGCLQAMPSEILNSPSFAPRSSVGYEHGGGQRPRSMMSPPRINLYQQSHSQIPARIQGLDDMEELEEELNPATPSSPHT